MLRKLNSVAVAALIGMWLTTSILAQEKRESPDKKKEANISVDTKDTREGAKVKTMLHRSSEIAGMKVRNTANKDLGSIKDIVIDMRAGMVKYAALSYGGFLGLGDKLFAVPWDVLQHHHDANSGDPYFVLDIDEATLKRSPGFDSSNWPDFSDQQFESKLDTFYDKFRKNRAEVTTTAKTNATDKPSERLMLRSSVVVGMKVKNEAQKELGKVNDLVIEIHPGKIRYAALSYGGFLGLGDKLFAVPWKSFEVRHDISAKEVSLVLNVDEAQLRKASGFDKNKWPNFADPNITKELDEYYGVSGERTSARPKTDGAIIRENKDR